MTSESEIAWAAGLFEGEGCISWWREKNTQRRRVAIVLKLHMTDRDIVERFFAVVACGSIRPLPRQLPHHQDQWLWQVGSIREVEAVLGLLGPWFGERRRAKMLEALEAHRSQGPRLKPGPKRRAPQIEQLSA